MTRTHKPSPLWIPVIGVSGSHVKCLRSAEVTRRFASGPDLTPQQVVEGVLKRFSDSHFDLISIGYPGVMRQGAPVLSRVTTPK